MFPVPSTLFIFEWMPKYFSEIGWQKRTERRCVCLCKWLTRMKHVFQRVDEIAEF